MILLAGINGAGKTTFYYTKIKPFLESQGLEVPFVNADEIEKANFPDEIGQHSYTAAREAARLRDIYFETAQSFVTETVFSYQSKIDLIGQAQAKGFEVVLNHVHVDHPEKAIKRVETRIETGGHAVPEKKIRERFPRTMKNLQIAVTKADRAYVWDNNHQAKIEQPMHRFVLSMYHGKINKLSNTIPNWARQMYGEYIKAYHQQKEAVLNAARTSLQKDSSAENKQKVWKILKEAGIQYHEINTVFNDYGGLPSFFKIIRDRNQRRR